MGKWQNFKNHVKNKAKPYVAMGLIGAASLGAFGGHYFTKKSMEAEYAPKIERLQTQNDQLDGYTENLQIQLDNKKTRIRDLEERLDAMELILNPATADTAAMTGSYTPADTTATTRTPFFDTNRILYDPLPTNTTATQDSIATNYQRPDIIRKGSHHSYTFDPSRTEINLNNKFTFTSGNLAFNVRYEDGTVKVLPDGIYNGDFSKVRDFTAHLRDENGIISASASILNRDLLGNSTSSDNSYQAPQTLNLQGAQITPSITQIPTQGVDWDDVRSTHLYNVLPNHITTRSNTTTTPVYATPDASQLIRGFTPAERSAIANATHNYIRALDHMSHRSSTTSLNPSQIHFPGDLNNPIFRFIAGTETGYDIQCLHPGGDDRASWGITSDTYLHRIIDPDTYGQGLRNLFNKGADITDLTEVTHEDLYGVKQHINNKQSEVYLQVADECRADPDQRIPAYQVHQFYTN